MVLKNESNQRINLGVEGWRFSAVPLPGAGFPASWLWTIMTKNTLIWVLVIWILSNAIFPLALNSIERLYKNEIDRGIDRGLRGLRWLILAACQVVFIAYFAPLILILGFLERIYPAILKTKIIQRSEIYPSMQLLVTTRFWPTVAASFRQKQQKNNKSGEKG